MPSVPAKLHWTGAYLGRLRASRLFVLNTLRFRCLILMPNPTSWILYVEKGIDEKKIKNHPCFFTSLLFYGFIKYVGFARSVMSTQHFAILSRHAMMFTTATRDVSFIKISLFDLMFFFSSDSETLNSS